MGQQEELFPPLGYTADYQHPSHTQKEIPMEPQCVILKTQRCRGDAAKREMGIPSKGKKKQAESR